MAGRTCPVSREGYQFEPLSYAVFGACIAVSRKMGVHCMEVDYQRALALELKARGLEYEREVEIPAGLTVCVHRAYTRGKARAMRGRRPHDSERRGSRRKALHHT